MQYKKFCFNVVIMRPKTKAGIGAAAALIGSLFATAPADAQGARSRQRAPPSAGMAMPRQTVPRIPSHLATGVRWRGPGASVQIYYQRGAPFFMGFPGYFWSDFWFPDGYGPRFPPYGARMPYGAVVAQQWANVSRWYPPIGWGGWNTLAAGQYASPDEGLMRENQELRERLQQYQLDAARQEGYEQARREFGAGQSAQPMQPAQQPVQPQPMHAEPKTEFTGRYDGNVAKNQYDDVAIEVYRAFFRAVEILTNGEKQLVPYDIRGNSVIGIRDRKRMGSGDSSVLATIDLSGYERCMQSYRLTSRLLEDLKKTGLMDSDLFDRAESRLDISNIKYSANCR